MCKIGCLPRWILILPQYFRRIKIPADLAAEAWAASRGSMILPIVTTADACTILVRALSTTASHNPGIFLTSLPLGRLVIIMCTIMMFLVVEYIVLLMYRGVCIV